MLPFLFYLGGSISAEAIEEVKLVENRIALIGIVVENEESIEDVNKILHDAREYVIGRMGIPYREKKICIINVSLDAPEKIISTLGGKLGMLDGVTTNTVYAKKRY